jgi:hypothetical protein
MKRPTETELNIQRLKYARAALKGYYKAAKEKEEGTPEEGLTDLLSDLRHWARDKEVDFDASLRMSLSNYNAEVADALEETSPTA